MVVEENPDRKKSSYRRRRGETLAKCCVLFYGLLQTLSHIRIRLMKSSFDLLLYKTLKIIFNYILWTKNMWKSKTRVTSYEFRCAIYEFKRVTSSNPRVTSSNPQVTSSNLQVTSSNPWVRSSNSRFTSLNPRVTSSNSRVTSLNPRVTSSNPEVWRLKAQIGI